MIRTRYKDLLRVVTGLACVLLAAVTMGCPRDLNTPDPTDAQVCTVITDCNEMRCGFLRACIGGYCTKDPSLSVPCTDVGPMEDTGSSDVGADSGGFKDTGVGDTSADSIDAATDA